MNEKIEFRKSENIGKENLQKNEGKENAAEISKSMEKECHPDFELIKKKLEICKFANPENFSFTNNYQMASNLYTAIFFPQQTREIWDMINTKERFPDGLQILSQPMSFIPDKTPTRDEFIEKIRHIITKEVDYGSCVNEGAEKFLQDLMRKGKTNVIFTNGDHAGVREYDLPGTKQQLHKIGSLKFPNVMRREIAQEENRNRKDVLSIFAHEDKMKLLPEIMEKFAEKGVHLAIYIDDRLANLIRAQEISDAQTKENIKIFPIWIRQGRYKNAVPQNQEASLDSYVKEFHAVEKLESVGAFLDSDPVVSQAAASNELGFIVDLDEVVIDGNKQKVAELEAIVRALQKKQWI